MEVWKLPNETSITISKLCVDFLEKVSLTLKDIACWSDNCNTMFGGLNRKEIGINVFVKLKLLLQKLIGVDCLVHILINGVYSESSQLTLYIEDIIYKMYPNFSHI